LIVLAPSILKSCHLNFSERNRPTSRMSWSPDHFEPQEGFEMDFRGNSRNNKIDLFTHRTPRSNSKSNISLSISYCLKYFTYSFKGYNVEEGTVVFINNHNLSMSPKLWDEPEVYEPSRFLDPRTGQFTKPEYFQVLSSLFYYVKKIFNIISFDIQINAYYN